MTTPRKASRETIRCVVGIAPFTGEAAIGLSYGVENAGATRRRERDRLGRHANPPRSIVVSSL
jgi:hypothetical protein